jgi:hypothetical protein
MCAKGLRALIRFVVAGVKDQERRQGRLAVCGHVARCWMSLASYFGVLLRGHVQVNKCEQGLGGVFFLAVAVICVPKGCGR